MHKHGSLTFLTKCNFATNTLAHENLPIFYEKILNYWSELKNSTGYDFKSRYKDEILWNNRNILIAKKTVFYKHWFDAGISKIDDLLNGQNGFLNWQEFRSKFNLNVPFTQYYGLINAIPVKWKTNLENPVPAQAVENTVSPDPLTTRSIYSALIKTVFVPPTAKNGILSHGFTSSSIQNVYLLPFTITNEVKTITFQYKVIHNVLPTRATLFRDGVFDSATCNFCDDKEQTLNHLLIDCASTVSFWTSFLVWWNTKANENLIFTPTHILYGWHERTRHWRILNYCLLIAKYYIFCTSLRGDDLNLQNYLLIMHEKLETLKEIAIVKKALSKYYRTWAVLL